MTPAFIREHVTGLIAGSQLEIVADSGHYLPLEKPAELAGLIERFLGELLAL